MDKKKKEKRAYQKPEITVYLIDNELLLSVPPLFRMPATLLVLHGSGMKRPMMEDRLLLTMVARWLRLRETKTSGMIMIKKNERKIIYDKNKNKCMDF